MTAAVEAAILSLLADLPPGKSVAPEDVARALDPAGWRRELGKVRGVAVGRTWQGRLVILRHGKPADPDTFKGVWRMRLPNPGDPSR